MSITKGIYAIIALFIATLPVAAQTIIDVEMQGTANNGTTPLWLNANKYGVSSMENSCFLRVSATDDCEREDSSTFNYGYGADVILADGMSSTMFVQQAYVEGRWLKGKLTIGSKEEHMELKNQRLSSGSQTLGINSHPIPQIRLALDEFWNIPGSNSWLGIKGHIAYGMKTDSQWQKDFTHEESRYCTNTLYHSKAGYLRIGKDTPELPITITLGLEMGTQFGGETHTKNPADEVFYHRNNLSAFWHALMPGGADVTENGTSNAEGDLLGSWVARVDYQAKDWILSVYADKFFEDHSAMFMLDYDGYGSGENKNVKEKTKFHLYEFKDIMLGAEWKSKKECWLDNIVFEYLYTKYQSGAVFHDHTANIPEHYCGKDDYYNSYNFTPWQHWGQLVGNPLYLSPVYNKDGDLSVKNNRFAAWHLGFSGHPANHLNYRVLASFQDGMGTYQNPYIAYRRSFNMLMETTYQFGKKKCDWRVRTAIGVDRGNIHGNNYGAQLTIGKTL